MSLSIPLAARSASDRRSDRLSSRRRLSFENLEERRLLSSAPNQLPDASWIQLGMVAYQTPGYMLAPTAKVYGTTGNGAGYQNGDIVTLPAYTALANIATTGYSTTPASFQLTVINGNVTAATLVDSGDYPFSTFTAPVYPSNPVSVAGGSGAGLEFSVTWESTSVLNNSGDWVAQNIDLLDGPAQSLVPPYAAQTSAQELLYCNYYGQYLGSAANQNLIAWCEANGIDPETMYLHYDTRTTVNFKDGSGAVTLPGFAGPITTFSAASNDTLSINGIDTVTTAGSSAYAFQYSDVGKYITIAGGTGFRPDSYEITGIDAATNTATLGMGLASGLSIGATSSTGGTGWTTQPSTYSDGTPAPYGSRVPTYGWYGNVGLPYETGSRVVMNVGDPNYRAWCNYYYPLAMSAGGFTGLFIDNVGQGGPGVGTVVPSGDQTYYEYTGVTVGSSASAGLTLGNAAWSADYVSCIASSNAAFGSNYSIYANTGDLVTNWAALLPNVSGVFREFYIQPGSATASHFNEALTAVAQAQAYGTSNVLSATGLFDDSPPTAEICYPGYFYSDRAISALAQYYLMADPTDYFCDQDHNAGDPLDFFNFGALNYDVGAPSAMPSGDVPVVDSTGPAGCYVFATGLDASSPQQDSGTATWAHPDQYDYVLTDPTKNWTVNEWQNMYIEDSAGNIFKVSSNTSDAIRLYNPSNIPVSGSYQLASYTYTVYARQYGNALVLYKPASSTTDFGDTAASAAVVNAGSGYTNDDIVTVQDTTNGGTSGVSAYGAQAQFELTVNSNGVVTAATLYNNRAGNYSVFPSGPVTVTGGTGSGLTLSLTQTPGTLSSATTFNLPASPTGNWYFLNADGTVSGNGSKSQITLEDGEAAILVTQPSSNPVLSNIETTPVEYVAGQDTTPLTASITVGDGVTPTLTKATVQITGNYQPGEDVLSFTNTSNITGTWNPTTGTMILTGTDTLADYQAALESVTYTDTSSSPTGGLRTVSIQVVDYTDESNVVTRPIAVDSAPVLANSESTPLLFVQGQPATQLSASITVSDSESTTLAEATVTISGDYQSDEDLLSFSSTPLIAQAWDQTTGTLTLTGTDTLADYQAAFQSVTYFDNTSDPTGGLRTVSFQVNDGTAWSNVVTRQIAVDPGVVLSPTNLPDAAVGAVYEQSITASGGTGNLSLVVSPIQNPIDGLVVPPNGSGSLTISGTPLAAGTETFTVTATDSLGATTNEQFSIRVDNPLVLGGIGGTELAYMQGDAPAAVSGAITIGDPPSITSLTGGTVQISSGFTSGEDLLIFANTPLITGTWDQTTGTLTLTGTATLAQYQAALQTVTYYDTSFTPTAGTRTISIQVSDGPIESNVVTQDVVVTALATHSPIGGDVVDIVGDAVIAGDVDVTVNGVALPPVPAADIPQWSFSGSAAGGNQLVVDFTYGNPLPGGGLTYNPAGAAASNSLTILGIATSDQVVDDGELVTVDGSPAIACSNVGSFSFGTASSGTGNSGAGIVVAAGTVLGDVGALSSGGSLVVGAGGVLVIGGEGEAAAEVVVEKGAGTLFHSEDSLSALIGSPMEKSYESYEPFFHPLSPAACDAILRTADAWRAAAWLWAVDPQAAGWKRR